MPNVPPMHITLRMSTIAIGAPLRGDEFAFGIFAEDGAELYTARNDSTGHIVFHNVRFDYPGTFQYTARVTQGPTNYWVLDPRVWHIEICVTQDADDRLYAVVRYPEGVPLFMNTYRDTTCGRIEFPELIFTAPGVHRYTLRELTPSGEGWITDDREIDVIVTVVDDGHGNLVATVEYPDEFPTFVNTYAAVAVRVKINACKTAIGAPLPAGRFEFGLFNEAGVLISTTRNGPADETFTNPPGDDDDDN